MSAFVSVHCVLTLLAPGAYLVLIYLPESKQSHTLMRCVNRSQINTKAITADHNQYYNIMVRHERDKF